MYSQINSIHPTYNQDLNASKHFPNISKLVINSTLNVNALEFNPFIPSQEGTTTNWHQKPLVEDQNYGEYSKKDIQSIEKIQVNNNNKCKDQNAQREKASKREKTSVSIEKDAGNTNFSLHSGTHRRRNTNFNKDNHHVNEKIESNKDFNNDKSTLNQRNYTKRRGNNDTNYKYEKQKFRQDHNRDSRRNCDAELSNQKYKSTSFRSGENNSSALNKRNNDAKVSEPRDAENCNRYSHKRDNTKKTEDEKDRENFQDSYDTAYESFSFENNSLKNNEDFLPKEFSNCGKETHYTNSCKRFNKSLHIGSKDGFLKTKREFLENESPFCTRTSVNYEAESKPNCEYKNKEKHSRENAEESIGCKSDEIKFVSSFKQKRKYRDLKLERDQDSNNLGQTKSFQSTERLEKQSPNLLDDLLELNDEECREFIQEYKMCYPRNLKITEKECDLFEVSHLYSLAHCVAADFKMSSGIALKFKTKFERLEDLLEQHQSAGGLAILKEKTRTCNGNRFIYYLVTKQRSHHKPTYTDFWNSIKKLREHVKQNCVKRLAIPKLGCGLDKLDWLTVKHIVEFVFRNVDIKILYCKFETQDFPKIDNDAINVFNYTGSLCDIEEKSVILYMATADGYISEEMKYLDKKYGFLKNYKNVKKSCGTILKHSTDYHYICGLIVRRNSTDSFSFKSLKKCIEELNEITKSYEYTGFALNYICDEEDELLHYKIIIMLQHYLKYLNIYVYRSDLNKSVEVI